MEIYTCPKCGKKYQRKSFYEKHVKSCVGKQSSAKHIKKKNSSVEIKGYNNILSKIKNIDTRLSSLEKRFEDLDLKLYKRNRVSEKPINLPLNDELELINIIKDIINQTSNPYSIRGVISLSDLKKNFEERYKISKKEFEGLILKLHRKSLVDLQAGGTSGMYQLKSPTGKEFYYLMIK